MTSNRRQRIEIDFDLGALYHALDQPLGLVDSPEKRADLQAYLAAAQVHLERAVYEFLTTAATTLTASDADLAAHVEYRPGGPALVFEPGSESEPVAPPPFIEGDLERVTIRLPAELKDLIDKYANLQGLSANSWYIRELARTIGRQKSGAEPPGGERQHRTNRRGSLKGFVGGD